MPATNATPAKLAVFAALREESGSGLLGNIQIEYAAPGTFGPRCIYGGGYRFDQEEKTAEGTGLLVWEVVAVSLYVRVLRRPSCPVEDADADAHAIGGLITKVFTARPKLAGDMTWLGIASGMGDYLRTADETIATQSYQVRIGSYLSWGV